MRAADKITIGSKRTVLDNGFLVIHDCVIARAGIQTYRRSELGLDGDGVIRLYRPDTEVFNTDSLHSFENSPVTIDHPDGFVTADNWHALAVGDAVNIKQNETLVVATLNVKSKRARDAIDSGKTELSNGYTFDLDLTAGVVDGQEYDGIQRNIRGNHVAIVDKARCGSVCKIADNSEGEKMTQKLIVDGVPVEVDDVAAAAITKLQNKIKTAADQIKDLKTEHQKALSDKDAEIQTLKTQIMTPQARDAMLSEWSKLIADAKSYDESIVTDGKTCDEIRRAVIKLGKDADKTGVIETLLAGKSVETIDSDTAKTLFAAVLKLKPAETVVTDNIGTQFLPAQSKPGELVGRDAMIARDQARFQ